MSRCLRIAAGNLARISSKMPFARTAEPKVAVAGSGHSDISAGGSTGFRFMAMVRR